MSYNPEDDRLDSVESYVNEVRTMLLDQRHPHRYKDHEILTAFNTCLAEARRVRADLFIYRHGNHVPYYTAISGETVPIDTQFRLAFVYGIAGHVLERDDEDVQDVRAAAFEDKFYSILIGIKPGPLAGGNKGPGSPQA